MALVRKIISGGQIGADVAGLFAAQYLGLETGGWMPKDFQTFLGPRPDYESQFNMMEHECRGYPPRTRQNVLESDGTVRFAYNFNSPGERCTLNAIEEYDKPYHDIALSARGGLSSIQQNGFIAWLRDWDIEVLNVAGNARADLELRVRNFLISSLTIHNRNEALLRENS